MTARHALIAAALLAVAMPTAAGAVMSTGEPAALLIFPLITIDDTNGTDSLIELTNTDGADVAVRCLYENPSGGPSFTTFAIHLAANQPVAWHASRGAAVPGDGGAVPPLGGTPFTGVLRCLTVDAGGKPSDRNVLVGSATIERFDTAAGAVDSARYSATGVDALPGASNGDDQLVLGGPAAEYAPCPNAIVLQAFLDGAVLDFGVAGSLPRQLSTTLVLVTCSQRSSGGARANLGLSVTDEFGLTLYTGRSFSEQFVVPLSKLDTADPSQSIFSSALHGSLTGVIRITPGAGSDGVLALALETHADPDSGGRSHSAAASPQLDGERVDPAVIDLAVPTPPSCTGDCDGNGMVGINELIVGVNIALGTEMLSACPAFDADGGGSVAISELVAAVNHALSGC